MQDIAIIGGGIIGLLTAREFAAAGAKVTLIDRQSTGREASWAGGGILLPLYPWRQADAISILVSHSRRLYSGLSQSLADDTGIDPEHTVSGLLITENLDIEAALRWCTVYSVPFERPAAKEIREKVPALAVQTFNPLWLPDVAHIRNPRLLKALRADLDLRGVKVLENREATGLTIQDDRVVAVDTASGAVSADWVVLTTGAWSKQLWKDLFPNLDVFPVKGQMLLFDAEPGLLDTMILRDGHYLIPRRDGKILAGSTVEHVQFDKTPTEKARSTLQAFALETLPPLAKYPILRHWAGLRPGTPEGIPYIDIHPKIGNLAINCGHFRNGLVMGPTSARLAVDLVLQREPCVPPAPYVLPAPH